VPSEDPESIVILLGGVFNEEFHSRDSCYWGNYWMTSDERIRVFSNRDPMYLPGDDPPEDRFFEAAYSVYGTLVDVEGEQQDCQQVVEALTALIAESVVISDQVG
jgi:hypothetical protein